MEYLHAEVAHDASRDELRKRLNPDLALYTPPMEMLENGQIVEEVPDELDPLVSEPVADDVPAEFADPLTHAIEQFRRRGASEQDKRSALRQLAGVLEPLRADIKKHALSADESAIFQLANKFAIRHTPTESSSATTTRSGSTGCSTCTWPRRGRCSRCSAARSYRSAWLPPLPATTYRSDARPSASSSKVLCSVRRA